MLYFSHTLIDSNNFQQSTNWWIVQTAPDINALKDIIDVSMTWFQMHFFLQYLSLTEANLHKKEAQCKGKHPNTKDFLH